MRPAGLKENGNNDTMAIYHLSMKILSRSKGYSAVASAAYRAGEKILDERTGVIHDYTRKNGVASAVILTPANAPAWCANRAELWNAVEKAERRKNSQLAREFELAIPRELAQDAARETVLNFVRENFVSRGMIADVAFHNLGGSNPHAHIMLSMRAITPDGFGEKVREWNDWTHAETWRGSWADHANRALANAGYQEEIDHRSYERQGVEKTPGIHLGKSACAMEKWGIETERGEQNRLINRLNLEIQVSRDELRNSELTEPARRMADLLNIELPDNATSYILHDIIEALPTDSNAAWKLTSKAMSMMADMQATRRRWEDLNTERKEAMSHAASLKKSSPFSSGFSRIPLMQWVAPEYGREQEKIQSLSQRMEKLRQHHVVKTGIEVCNFQNQSAVKDILQNYDFDYVIGSVHFLRGWAYDSAEIKAEWQNHSLQDIYEWYTEEIEKLADSGLYDVLGHPFNIRLFKFLPDFDVTPYLLRAVKALKKANMIVDINTGTFYRYPIAEISPYPDFMKLAAKYELPVITTSDAHKPEDCGAYNDEAVAYAKSYGYTKTVQFNHRQRNIVPLG